MPCVCAFARLVHRYAKVKRSILICAVLVLSSFGDGLHHPCAMRCSWFVFSHNKNCYATCKRLLRSNVSSPFVEVASVRGSLAHHRELLAPFTLLPSRTAII